MNRKQVIAFLATLFFTFTAFAADISESLQQHGFTQYSFVGYKKIDTELKYSLTAKEKDLFNEKINPKVFTKDNCELRMNWHSRSLEFQLIYRENLPKKLTDYLNNPNQAKIFSAFYIIFLDDNNSELLKDMCYFSAFTVEDGGAGKQAILKDSLICDSDIYRKISSVVIDFSQ